MDCKYALYIFYKEVGVYILLSFDPSAKQTSKAVYKFCNQVGTIPRILEESNQWDSWVKLYIDLFKKTVRKYLSRSDCPTVLCDYYAERRVLIYNLAPRNLFQTDKRSPSQYQFGVQCDISNLCSFNLYDCCYYLEEVKDLFSYQKEILGRALGPTKNEGNEMP